MAAGLPLLAKFQSRLTTNLLTTNLPVPSDHKSLTTNLGRRLFRVSLQLIPSEEKSDGFEDA